MGTLSNAVEMYLEWDREKRALKSTELAAHVYFMAKFRHPDWKRFDELESYVREQAIEEWGDGTNLVFSDSQIEVTNLTKRRAVTFLFHLANMSIVKEELFGA